MPILALDRVHLAYSGGPEVLAGVSLTLRGGEAVAVVGRSGSGKTSLLSIAAGFERPTAGSVRLDGRPVEAPGADRAVVFQDDALFPWLNARDNVAFALRLKGLGRAERGAVADRWLARVGLEGLGNRPVWELSGGMRQRVGIARALAAEPAFLLMDEPFGALDTLTRERMQDLLIAVAGSIEAGVLLITHSLEEALLVADRVVVLAPGPGRIVEIVEVPWRRRVIAGARARALRAEPAFVALRERLADLVAGEDLEAVR
jgi:taurine transport system ATP-binding protein